MNSIVEQACNSVNGHSAPDAFNLIEQQAERIKELEAKCDHWRDHYKDLRQRIDDAPVVAWAMQQDLEMGTKHIDCWAYKLPSYTVPLISKEDLQR